MSLTAEEVGLKPLSIWNDCHTNENAAIRLERIRQIAPTYKAKFTKQKSVLAVRSLPTSIAPFPVTFAFNRTCRLPYKYMLFSNKATLVQFFQQGKPKLLLFNPTIPERSIQAPFFADFADKLPFSQAVRSLFLESPPLPDQLRRMGIEPEDIDYVAFDHQHVQDMRPFLGTDRLEPLYPKAKFLVQQADFESSRHQHPLQRPWFVPNAGESVRTDRLVLLQGDVELGEGCALLFTPGHTWGNQTLYFRAPKTGCYTISENGVCMDSYTPEHSRIPGLATHARRSGEEVILNANTLEGSLEQYNSMIKEKLVADAYGPDKRFVQHFSSSELIHSPMAPGLRPTHAIKAVNEGAFLPRKNRLKKAAARAPL